MEYPQLESKLGAVIDKHKDHIVPLLKGKSTDLSCALLRNDEAVRTVATYCHALLPGVVRLAVKEAVFIAFVMKHRERLLGRLVAEPQTQADGGVVAG